MAKPSSKKPISFEKPKKQTGLTEPSLTIAPEYSAEETVAKPEKPKSITKVPKIVEVIESDKPIVSVVAKKETIYPNLDISERAQRFNRIAIGSAWKSRSPLESLAKEFLGDSVVLIVGLNQNEIAFESEGIRVPKDGYYHVRP
jgi:hypothetical protein